MTGVYRMADLNIRIDSLYAFVQDQCAEYGQEGLPDLTVQTSERDIQDERDKAAREDARMGRPVYDHADAYLESLAAYRKIAEKLPAYDGFVFHGSCVAVDGRGYVFTAKSGTGKSTHTRLWRELLGNRAVMVNDDKPVIRFVDGVPFIYGTPWDGKERLSKNTSVPLQAICLLDRAAENHIRTIDAHEALPLLIQQTYRPASPAALEKTMALLERLTEQAKLYRLGCNMALSAAELSYHAMKEE